LLATSPLDADPNSLVVYAGVTRCMAVAVCPCPPDAWVLLIQAAPH
jgi:hypothetical protein